jgi:hypothetical protein
MDGQTASTLTCSALLWGGRIKSPNYDGCSVTQGKRRTKYNKYPKYNKYMMSKKSKDGPRKKENTKQAPNKIPTG